MAKIDIVHVPYKGSGPAITDLIGGQVTMNFDTMPAVAAHVKADKMRPLAVTSSNRSAAFPEVLTVAESGYPGFEVYTWYGVFAPAGTPKEIVTKLNKEIVRILQLPDVKERLASLGSEQSGGTPEEFGSFVKTDIARWPRS
jgi:tripartite-type tricarboxylate transporter receptor subunit TctC